MIGFLIFCFQRFFNFTNQNNTQNQNLDQNLNQNQNPIKRIENQTFNFNIKNPNLKLSKVNKNPCNLEKKIISNAPNKEIKRSETFFI